MSITRQDFRHVDRLRVRWAEVDMQKIVFNGHYLAYVDTAVGGYWRALALPYQEAMQRLAGDLFVRKATLDYHAAAEYDDLLEIGVRCHRVGQSSLQFQAAVFRGPALLVAAELVYVFADPVARVSRPVPAALRQIFDDYEAGRPMVQVRVGAWQDLAADAQALRSEVFVAEQQVPASLEQDGADGACLHAVAYNGLGMPVATGRLLPQGPGVVRIGRMAVKRAMRGQRIGDAVLAALVEAAQERGERDIVLHAQVSAVSFYRRAGFEVCGPTFEEAGIAHIEMTRRLA